MSRIFKTLVILVIILFSVTTLVYATDINMNLENQNQTDTNSATDSNSVTDNGNAVDSNTITDSNTVDPNDTLAADNFQQDNIGGSVAPSGVSSIAQENMSFSNVLNILVITVGVILILLAIAILIRLKN